MGRDENKGIVKEEKVSKRATGSLSEVGGSGMMKCEYYSLLGLDHF